MDIPSPPESVLVYVYEDTIGDGLVKLPFVRVLRRRFPRARITWCAGVGPSSYAGVLAPVVEGLLDEVIERAGVGGRALRLLCPHRPLGGRHFDVVIDTQRVLARSLAARRIRHGTFVSGALGYRLSDKRPAKGAEAPRHLVAYLKWLLDLAAPASGDDGRDPPLHIPDGMAAAARDALPEGPVYVGIAPGAGDPAKIWPLERFIAVARAQAGKGRVPVFFIGPEEEAWLDGIRAAVPDAKFPEWDGNADLRGPVFAIALAQRLSAAVANDSGAGHMLAAGGAPLVSLFSKHDPEKYAPGAMKLTIVDSKSFGGTDPALIPPEFVISALDGMLSAAENQ